MDESSNWLILSLTISSAPPSQGSERPQQQQQPSWSILREDYMMGSRLRDWDKRERGEEEEGSSSDDDDDDDV